MADITKMLNAYYKHLNIIKELGIVDRTDDYICPLCLHGFNKEDINKLSLEDAPQEKLGGNKIAITCKHCNNTCGNTVDYHLINYLQKKENKLFLSGTDRKTRIVNLGSEVTPIQASLKVYNHDDIDLVISSKNNNPHGFKEKIDMVYDGKVLMAQDIPIRIDSRYVSAAIIKNAYIILFSKTGYTFLLDKYYDRIREYIEDPSSPVVCDGMFRPISDTNCIDGIYMSNNKACRGFYVIYTITRIKAYRLIVYIPSPLLDFDDAIAAFHEIKSGEGLLSRKLDSKTLLWEKEEIEALRRWLYTWG